MNVFYDEVQMMEIKEAFSAFDKTFEGYIDCADLGKVMCSLGDKPTNAEILQIQAEFDWDNNGVLDFMEFLKLMESRARLQEKVND